jgi:hypothetical protein
MCMRHEQEAAETKAAADLVFGEGVLRLFAAYMTAFEHGGPFCAKLFTDPCSAYGVLSIQGGTTWSKVVRIRRLLHINNPNQQL